jgi:hypothetical protein
MGRNEQGITAPDSGIFSGKLSDIDLYQKAHVADAEDTTVVDLKCGLCLIHNHKPVELIYLAYAETIMGLHVQHWVVRPLFVDLPEREELFTVNDNISALHVQYARTASGGS